MAVWLAVWLSGNALVSINVSYSTLSPVSGCMGDHLYAGKQSRYVNSHGGQLSLVIPLWVGVMSTSLGWEGVALAMDHRQ